MKPQSWKFIKKHESSFNLHCAKNIKRYIDSNPKSYPTTLEELMEICGVKVDLESVRLYQKFHSFLMKQRKLTMQMFEELITMGYFEQYKTEGLHEKEIYRKFIDTCLSYEIVPLSCDVDNKYKLCDLSSFLEMIESRLRSTGSELKQKFEYMSTMGEILPQTITGELEALQGDFQMLKDARDHLIKYLPSGEET